MIGLPNSKPSPKESSPINKYARIENLELIKTLNYGVTSKVKLGRDIETKQEYAVKIIKKEFQERYLSHLDNEATFLEDLKEHANPNIIKLIRFLPKASYIKKNGNSKKVVALILEYAEGGDLFEVLAAIGELKEDISRTYFIQLIETIEFLHNKGIVHRDIKPDNLLLGKDFKLKIADFTIASYILSSEDTPHLREILGTQSYMAPELFTELRTTSKVGDIFACGVILFCMVTGFPPFEKATAQDTKYKFIYKNQHNKFWKISEFKKLSQDFKDLINGLLCYDPMERLTLCEIKAHPWLQGKVCSLQELQHEYEEKQELILKHQEIKSQQFKKEKELKKQTKLRTEALLANKPNLLMFSGITPRKTRSIEDQLTEEIKSRYEDAFIETERESEEYIQTCFRGLTEAFYPVSAEIMFKLLMLLAKNEFNEFTPHPYEFKIKARIRTGDEKFGGVINIQVLRTNEQSCCINFTRINGSVVLFYIFVEDVLKRRICEILQHYVDNAAPQPACT